MSSTNPTNAALQVEEKGPIAQMTPAAPVAPVAPVAPIAPINNTTTTTTTAVASPPRENRSGGEDNMEADQEDKSKLQLRRSSTPPTDDMQDTGYQSSSSASEYEPPDSPEPIVKAPKFAKTNKSTAASASAHKLFSSYSSSSTAPAHTTTTNTARATASKPHTPRPRSRAVKSGRVEKSGSASPAPTTLKCPVKGCGQTFTGRNPRQSLWHHLKYYSTRGLPDKEEFEAAHGAAHAAMKEEAEPKGTPIERNRLSSSDYRKKNPEKAKTSARLANFSARARKKGITNEKEIQEKVMQWEKEWQEKQAKEASEYFSSILLSAFE